MEPTREFEQGLRAGFIDAAADSAQDMRPSLICNSKELGTNLLSVIKRQMSTCDSFDFCVAFIADSGLQPLMDILLDLKHRGIRGRLITSTYLNFNSPSALRKLLEFENIQTRIYQGNLHAKGYLFDQGDTSIVIVGSSNLTQAALTCNKEWNVLFRSYERGGLLSSMKGEFDRLWNDRKTEELNVSWIERYESYRAKAQPAPRRLPAFQYEESASAEFDSEGAGIKPNAMQRMALEALGVLHARKEPRALLVSATGTGKTYLSAFDVQNERPERVLFLVHRKRILTASMRSFQRVLGSRYTYGQYVPGGSNRATCLFAMCSTISRHLEDFSADYFDYIIIDEAHRTGSGTYRSITSHFTPRFYFGMTATPNRTNGDYDVFALFNHVIAFQISLQDALANDMLAPFHYFGIADLQIDDAVVDDHSLFLRLTSEQRVNHIISKIEEYSVDRRTRRGLVFCSRNDEAAELSCMFNERGYRTVAISGKCSDAERDTAIDRLESGELEYIFSVDIFNEGVDIPSVNQIIMLRRTESAIVFVQQLGRGLRKAPDKDYALVLDFIGNYQKNFFVPVALSGDRTFNKDRLRRIVREGDVVIPGSSTVSFDRVAEARIYQAIDGGKFTGTRFLREEYLGLRNMLGRIPGLGEFDEHGSVDPLLIFKAFGSYHGFLKKNDKDYGVSFTQKQEEILKFISQKLANGKRPDELRAIRQLIANASQGGGYTLSVGGSAAARSAACVLSGAFANSKKFVPLIDAETGSISDEFSCALVDDEFKRQVLEAIDFGLSRYGKSYRDTYGETSFVLNEKYTYEEVCRLLNWPQNVNGQNIGGYKYDIETNTYPVFINYDKDPSISDSIKYEDRFISESELIAISKQGRKMDSPEILRLKAWPGNGMKIYLFMRKNKDDEGSKEFYFLGEMAPTGHFRQIVMAEAGKRAIEIGYRLMDAVRTDLYTYLTSDLDPI